MVHYQIKPLDDSTCEVHYTEKMESYGMLQKLNDMLLGTILMYFKRRRFKKMLDSSNMVIKLNNGRFYMVFSILI
ncbi:hypothetical protein EfmAA290_07770 [Enterococcus faecium]|nr:hypothetical protein EfmAA290_07770 [Enterococcus faecium]